MNMQNERLGKSRRAPVRRFEDLEVWKESMQLAVRVYEVMASSRDYGLRDQMQRAAVSVPSNIAEGYERGSSGELRPQIYLAGKRACVERPAMADLIKRSRKISAMLNRYIQVRRRDF